MECTRSLIPKTLGSRTSEERESGRKPTQDGAKPGRGERAAGSKRVARTRTRGPSPQLIKSIAPRGAGKKGTPLGLPAGRAVRQGRAQSAASQRFKARGPRANRVARTRVRGMSPLPDRTAAPEGLGGGAPRGLPPGRAERKRALPDQGAPSALSARSKDRQV